ncbi:MAG: hypothetical protein M1832_002216 [Thelocarpon impressellum]|nr:MAG: hypothetical protein M1832_002216 [Thelocarpon impressellum]
MSRSNAIPRTMSEPAFDADRLSPEATARAGAVGAAVEGPASSTTSATSSPPDGVKTPSMATSAPSSPSLSASLSRRGSFHTSGSFQDDWEAFPPLDRLTVFDLLDNLALPLRLERLQNAISAHTDKVRRQRERLKSTGLSAKDRVVEEWRRRVPPPDEQLDKYRRKMRDSVDRLGRRWSDTKAVTAREKVSFLAGVFNIFISGFLIGAYPEYFHVWYAVQLAYFMPIRWYTYHKRGYHYFLADLCYFVNMLLMLSIWAFPRSKRLFISTYCLAYGNNAVAIAMWRNSMVFHSLDKITSLFIHIMPPVALHCLVHLIPQELQRERFPAIYTIRHSLPTSKEHYTLWAMMLWATVPYAVWQLSYHFMITVRRREKIAAGRPTSFTWLRRSYSKTWIGRGVLALPDVLQEPAFMLIQYSYAVITMLPCPIWFWNRYLSAGFLFVVFGWSVYNGATFYIDVFGKRFQTELEQLKKDVARWQTSPGMDNALASPLLTPRVEIGGLTPGGPSGGDNGGVAGLLGATPPLPPSAMGGGSIEEAVADHSNGHKRSSSFDQIPLLDGQTRGGSIAAATTALNDAAGAVRERK